MTNLTWQIGNVSITRVEERVTPVATTALIPAFNMDHLEAQRDWVVPHFFTEAGEMLLSVHSFVLVSAGTTIVVDTCVGMDRAKRLPGDAAFPGRLAKAVEGGLAGVDVVLCTHLHFDHVGWNTIVVDDERVPTFPNARYLFARAELEQLALDDHMQVSEPSVQPLLDADLVDSVETDHRITDEVRLVPTPGHTPGHVSVLVESEGRDALITGDMAHTPLQFAYPELPAGNFDWDSNMSTATRHQVIEAYANTDTTLLGTHFAPPTSGHIRREGDRTWFDA